MVRKREHRHYLIDQAVVPAKVQLLAAIDYALEIEDEDLAFDLEMLLDELEDIERSQAAFKVGR